MIKFLAERRFNMADVCAMCIATQLHTQQHYVAGLVVSLIGIVISFYVETLGRRDD